MSSPWAGITEGLFKRVTFGGVVGKATLMFAAVGVAAAIALAWVGTSTYGAVAAMVIVVSALLALGVILLFAHFHPDVAILEGSQWLQYQNMIQAKGALPAIPAPAVTEELPPANAAPDAIDAVLVEKDEEEEAVGG